MTSGIINGVCRETIVKTLNTFHDRDSTIEIRILGVDGRKTRTDAGYFNNVELAADAVQCHARDWQSKGIYFCLNPVFTSLLARSKNRIQQYATTTTKDDEILLRRWLYIDLDPVRPAEISTADAEHAIAIQRANDIAEWMMEYGFPEPIVADSGNGAHLHFPINLTHDSETTALIKAVTQEVSKRFTDNLVTIDEAVFNAARICRQYGSWARKGDDTEERPHRQSKLIYVPDYLRDGWSESDAAGVEVLTKLAAMTPKTTSIPAKPTTVNGHHHNSESIDLRRLLTEHGVEYRDVEGSAKYPVKLHLQCPFDDSHIGKDAYVYQMASGALGFHCSHNSCSGHRWQDFKAAIGIETRRTHKVPISNSLSEFVGDCPMKPYANSVFADKANEFTPFPVEELPPVLTKFCREVAAAVGCDESFPAMVCLAVCAAAIGTSRQLCVKYGWFVPPILWTILVGESGTQKSPPFRMAMAPLKDKQQRHIDSFIAADTQYREDLKAYKLASKARGSKPDGDAPEPKQPNRPIRKRCIVQDSTIEALAPILNENPRGVLLARDELSGWLAGFDRYSKKASASSEVPKWLEIYNMEPITIDRKTGDERFLFVRRPSVSICGGIQPGILSRCLTSEHKENGLQSRLLMTFPPRQAKQWRDDELSPATQLAYGDCIRELFEFQGDESTGECKPATLKLSRDARALFRDYVDATGLEQSAMHGHLASQWSKLEEIPARLAIILHCVRQVTTSVADHWAVDGPTMQSAINLGEWFKNETLRIGRTLVEPEALREARHLAAWIQSRHGGRITARNLDKYRRDILNSDVAELKLIELVKLGFGSWQGTHKSREFVLNQ